MQAEIIENTAPPVVATKRVLIVEDDRMLARIYGKRLSMAGFSVEVAPDGVRGLEMAREEKPDLIVLDLKMPNMNGVEVLTHLRQDPELRELPVIVFTSVFLGDMVNQARQAGATKIMSKSHDSPEKLAHEVIGLIGRSEPPTGEIATHPVTEPAQADPREEYLRVAAGIVAELHRLLERFLLRVSGDLSRLVELHQKVRTVGAQAAPAGFPITAHIATALDALLKELTTRPQTITPSSVQTVADGIHCLAALLKLNEQPAECHFSQLKVLAVDDDPIALRLITHALGRAHLWTQNIDKSPAALQLLTENCYDLILLDIEMPGLTGPQLCSKLRQLPTNANTPVIFVTAVKQFERRQDAIAQGGDDLIAKPFLSAELAAKALTRLFTARN